MWDQIIQNLLPSLGFSAVFLFILSKLWDYHTTRMSEKDRVLEELNKRVLTAYEENTKVIQKNTTLTELVYEELRGKK